MMLLNDKIAKVYLNRAFYPCLGRAQLTRSAKWGDKNNTYILVTLYRVFNHKLTVSVLNLKRSCTPTTIRVDRQFADVGR